MKVTVQPGNVSGNIYAPASKSSMQRACAAALLNSGETTIQNPGTSNDDKAAIGVITALGATIVSAADDAIVIEGAVDHVSTESERNMNCGESGLGIRMFAPLAALGKQAVRITGTGSLLKRPMDFFDDIFPQLNIDIRSNEGRLPLYVKGPLQPKNISIDGSLSSQFLTGLLMAYGKACTQPTTITVYNLKSKPYIDLTLQVMKDFGYEVVNNNYDSFTIYPSKFPAGKSIDYTVEGDWSGGAFLLVAGAVAGNITVKGLDVFSTQADKAVLTALMDCGSVISIQEKQIDIACPPTGVTALKPFHFNATDCPDLFPPLVALAAHCNGTTVIEGVSRLAHKESDRGLTLQEEFGKMGIEITLQDDLMMIKGGTGVTGTDVKSHHDHRIAMACAVAGLKGDGNMIIDDAEAINKSYPDFYDHLKKLGVNLQ